MSTFYASGLASKHEWELAGEYPHRMLDPSQMETHAHRIGPHHDIVMDSGSYVLRNTTVNAIHQHQLLTKVTELDAKIRWVASVDSLSSWMISVGNFLFALEEARRLDLAVPIVPVYHLGEPGWVLDLYLDKAELVGIGGVVKFLHTHADPDQKTTARREIAGLCLKYPGRFHVFGCCDVKLINAIRHLVVSLDSSLWLRPRKYGKIQFANTRTGMLQEVHYRIARKFLDDLGTHPDTYPEYCLVQIGEALVMRKGENDS